MSEVFLSYRQTNDEQLRRVRAFGERLRACEIEIVLDQFLVDVNAGGPNEGWPQWSSERASKTDFVLIIGTEGWYQCFEGTQPPGTALGAAAEARVIRQRIYDASGVIDDIRIVRFDDTTIPTELRGYHHFHLDRDFEGIVRWLGGTIPIAINAPRTSIPHNLPSLQPFFGREEELKKIADALLPESRTWGALIDGPGGMGKTSLAVRAAYDAPPDAFEKIVFVSLKSRELDDDGVRDLSGFLISGLAELLNELARELDHVEIAKAPEDRRPRLLLDALRGTRTLLILDNLESLVKSDRDIVFNFVKRLPAGCKAILTSRRRIGSGAEELILEKLSEAAALAMVAKLAENNQMLAHTSEAERLELYRETAGKPLLLRWTAGQIGRGSCLTLADAITYLRSCPEGNDPLEFIFGDLVDDFSDAETHVLCVLTYFTLPAKVEHLSNIAGGSEIETDRLLRSLVNRSLVVPSDELKTFTVVPLVADFLSKKRPEVLANVGDRLEQLAFALVFIKNVKHVSLHAFEPVWPIIAAALPRFIDGANDRLQTVSDALSEFLHFTGRWDEWIALSRDAESRAMMASDFSNAGWRAYQAGHAYSLRRQPAEVLACANRAEAYWREAQASSREQAFAISLRGIGHEITADFMGAISAYREAVDLWRALNHESRDVVIGLSNLASAELNSGDLAGAERDYKEGLRIARVIDDLEAMASLTGNLATLAIVRKKWPAVEALARDALSMSERIGRQQLIALDCYRLANALMRQGKKSEAFPHAKRAVEIFARLGSPELIGARSILVECES